MSAKMLHKRKVNKNNSLRAMRLGEFLPIILRMFPIATAKMVTEIKLKAPGVPEINAYMAGIRAITPNPVTAGLNILAMMRIFTTMTGSRMNEV